MPDAGPARCRAAPAIDPDLNPSDHSRSSGLPIRRRARDGAAQASPQVKHPHVERAAYLAVDVVDSLTHRYAAHPELQTMSERKFVEEIVTLLERYLLKTSLPEAQASTRRSHAAW